MHQENFLWNPTYPRPRITAFNPSVLKLVVCVLGSEPVITLSTRTLARHNFPGRRQAILVPKWRSVQTVSTKQNLALTGSSLPTQVQASEAGFRQIPWMGGKSTVQWGAESRASGARSCSSHSRFGEVPTARHSSSAPLPCAGGPVRTVPGLRIQRMCSAISPYFLNVAALLRAGPRKIISFEPLTLTHARNLWPNHSAPHNVLKKSSQFLNQRPDDQMSRSPN